MNILSSLVRNEALRLFLHQKHLDGSQAADDPEGQCQALMFMSLSL